jgi:CrcB protein
MIWLAIAVGGALGSLARHGLNHIVHQRSLASAFPAGIFVINIVGSVAIGVLAGLLASSRLHLSEVARTFLVVGVLGGFTTFSSFSLDTLTLIRSGQIFLAGVNVVGQVTLSLVGVWVGFRLAH